MLEMADVLDPAGGEVVEHVNRMVVLDQQIAQMRPDEARAAGDEESHLVPVDHAECVEWRLRLRIVPPNPPRTRIATPPARSARIEPSPPDEPPCELDARSTEEGSAACGPAVLAPPAPEARPEPTALAVPEPEREGDDPPAPGGPIPAPKSGADELPLEEDWAPVCLARFRGSAYSLAAGEPGSIWTPGSRPVPACAEAVEQLIASTVRAPAIDLHMASTDMKIVSSATGGPHAAWPTVPGAEHFGG
jgi:hypothetical protein